MKITICSSMSFYKEMIEKEKQLKEMGHEVFIPKSTYNYVDNPGHAYNEDKEYCLNNDVLMDHYKKIKKSDAILALNLKKGDIDNYIEGSVLGEILISYYLGKKIFLLNDVPSEDDIRYVFEVKLTKPVVVNGDLSKIKPSPVG